MITSLVIAAYTIIAVKAWFSIVARTRREWPMLEFTVSDGFIAGYFAVFWPIAWPLWTMLTNANTRLENDRE